MGVGLPQFADFEKVMQPMHLNIGTLPQKWYTRTYSIPSLYFLEGDTAMGEKGSKDKAKKEERKKAKLNPKEKRKLKKEKKTGGPSSGGIPH